MKARIEDNIVVEIFRPVPGFSLHECYHPSLLEELVEVGNLQVGDVYTPPEPPVIPESPPVASDPEVPPTPSTEG